MSVASSTVLATEATLAEAGLPEIPTLHAATLRGVSAAVRVAPLTVVDDLAEVDADL